MRKTMITSPSAMKYAPDSSNYSNADDESESDIFNRNQIAQNSVDSLIGTMKSITLPSIKPQSNAKQRINTLEDATLTQYKLNEMTFDTVGKLSSELINTEDHIKQIIQQLTDNFNNQLRALRIEYDHRFDLQRAENKRLKDGFAALKEESSMTIKKLNLTIEKLQEVQTELGETNDNDDFAQLARVVSRGKTV
mmetsp:Transcript_16694/g.15056  ORF Transcript_16694/g.15056 Transcript_16694/m.15056 type:complete len:194 (-) Transcript_16694:13-594(-)